MLVAYRNHSDQPIFTMDVISAARFVTAEARFYTLLYYTSSFGCYPAYSLAVLNEAKLF